MPKINRYKKISEEIIHKNPWWEYKKDIYEGPDKVRGEYFYGDSFGGSLVIPVLDDGRLLLVAQHRYLHDRLSVEFPSGHMDLGEAPQATAERELFEETGFKSSNFFKINFLYESISTSKSPLHVFVADELTQVGEPESNSLENIEILFRRVDEFEEMIKRGEVIAGATLGGWAMARESVLKIIASRLK